ncbi:hypothetical protein E1B28_003267 [Marasmius oreades]|uniref:Uncharacterized protein n=1 Tax=Marasmius oreades TaxID=181124 RepID=A0A9P7RMR2_9AGAR|nr:uncharacterized protein E1B28_003267 [Marasmius oreades]KAG7085723.1 hypothetical protein E1B28_003267 [Marasmius oreades]
MDLDMAIDNRASGNSLNESGTSLSRSVPHTPARSNAGFRAQNILSPPSSRFARAQRPNAFTPPATPAPNTPSSSKTSRRALNAHRGRSSRLPEQGIPPVNTRTPSGNPGRLENHIVTLEDYNHEDESSADDRDDYVPDPPGGASTTRRGRRRLSEPSGSSHSPRNLRTPRRAPRRSDPVHATHRIVPLEDYNDSEESSDDMLEDYVAEEVIPQDSVEAIDETTEGLCVGLSTAEVEQLVLQLCQNSNEPENETPQFERTLESHRLLPYQVKGVDWMIGRENVERKKMGGILADETGLGKTVQTCALIKYDHVKNPQEVRYHPTLVIVPSALVSQWEAECDKFLPALKVVAYRGSPKRRSMYELLNADIIITTYGVVRHEYMLRQFSADRFQAGHFLNSIGLRKRNNGRSIDEVLKDALFRIGFRRVVLDEGHNIRTHTTSRAKACYELQSTFRWCVTATPIHNSVMDYYSLLRFLRIKPYCDIMWFKEKIEKPVGKTIGWQAGKAIKRLQLCLTQVLIRRRKEEYTDGRKNLDLPPYIVHCDPLITRLSAEETEIYGALQARFSSIVNQFELSTQCIFVLLLRLRQACLHPSLLLKTYKNDVQEILRRTNESGSGDQDETGEFEQHNATDYCELCGARFSEINDNLRAHKEACKATLQLLARYACVNGEQRIMSERVKEVMRILREIPEGEKVIVFSQFTTMLDVMQEFLRDEGMRFVRYDGTMDERFREKSLEMIKDKNSGVRIILMSLKAGGVGLNLARCNHIILTDIWWNPAIEDQAIGRAHRMGQRRQVHIYKLVADGTIESRILHLQGKKRRLAEMTLASDQLEEVKQLSLNRAEVIALITGRDPRMAPAAPNVL